MKVLFLSINNVWTPHFETELELMLENIKEGNEVYVLTCEQVLDCCSSNPDNVKDGCLKCRARFWEGLKRVGISKENVIKLKRSVSKNLLKIMPSHFNDIEELKKFKLFGVDFGLAVASSLISELNDHKFDTILHSDKVFRNLKTALQIYESVLSVLKSLKPDLFYIFNGRFSDVRPAVRASQKVGITFYTHERSGDFNKFSLFKNRFPHDLVGIKRDIDQLWSSSSLLEEEKECIAKKWFYERRGGAEQGWFSFVKEQQKKHLPFGFDKTKKSIVIFNSSSDEFETFDEWRLLFYKDEIEACKKLISEFKNTNNIKFYLRVHPNLKNKNNSQIRALKKLDSLGYRNLKIIWPEEVIDSYALMHNCDKTIVFFSTMGVEACFWGKPSILLGRAMYEDLGCSYLPKDHNDFIELIKKDLLPKDYHNSLKYAYWQASKGIKFKYFQANGLFDGTFDGKKIEAKLSFWDKLILASYNKVKAIKRIVR